MSIGLGVVLIVVGLILLFALNVNIPFVSDDTLGTILLVAGILVVVLSLVMSTQRTRARRITETTGGPGVAGSRTEVVEERRDVPPAL
ncbi:MAG: hypothetical protein JWP61_1148 [Friedmanniella sp.]|nr:hypothetical protein [Friedmanniella sp.]